MIEYYLGERKCRIDFNKFLFLIYRNEKLYKSSFKNFADFFEFLDKNKKQITYLLFDNYEYFLKNGVLHNLYGPAFIRINDKDSTFHEYGHKFNYFFIDGRLVHDNMDDRGCKKLFDFQNKEIFFYEELTNKKQVKDKNGKYYRRKQNIDYIKIPINLEERIKIDKRNKKIKFLNEKIKK